MIAEPDDPRDAVIADHERLQREGYATPVKKLRHERDAWRAEAGKWRAAYEAANDLRRNEDENEMSALLVSAVKALLTGKAQVLITRRDIDTTCIGFEMKP